MFDCHWSFTGIAESFNVNDMSDHAAMHTPAHPGNLALRVLLGVGCQDADLHVQGGSRFHTDGTGKYMLLICLSAQKCTGWDWLMGAHLATLEGCGHVVALAVGGTDRIVVLRKQ